MTLAVAGRLVKEPKVAGSWSEFLKSKIDLKWRPHEFDPATLLLTPDPASKDTNLNVCIREGCEVHLGPSALCPACRGEFKNSRGNLSQDEWLSHAGPRRWLAVQMHCDVPGCERTHSGKGLCVAHKLTYDRYRAVENGSVATWMVERTPKALPPKRKCRTGCPRDAVQWGLCAGHTTSFRTWKRKSGGLHVDAWLNTWVEPYLDSQGTTYAERTVTAFGLLEEPLRWELLYAVQQREREGRLLPAVDLRSAYVALRRAGVASVVGLTALGLTDVSRTRQSLHSTWQAALDRAHREWSGADPRDPWVIYLQDLPTLRAGHRAHGPRSKMDLRPIGQIWIREALKFWILEAEHGYEQMRGMTHAWMIADSVINLRGAPPEALGPQDMDAIVAAIRGRWSDTKTQRRHIRWIKVLLDYARAREVFENSWGRLPVRFTVDAVRHRPLGGSSSQASGDEPFRFVPQPVVEHVMNNLGLLVRTNPHTGQVDPYLTAQSRAMIYVQERCGRRSGETVKLLDDCISYDDEGAPYLEWVRGKPPYTRGKRLPIHQETHDVIRQWQEIKREHGITSKWLFPKAGTANGVDLTWGSQYLSTQVNRLVDAIQQAAPLDGPVEGLEGNLVYFDMDTIDAYAFRHAFAQRYADATDAEGRPTTPPDVLQDLMGHESFNTTMGYYEVSAKRRKRVLTSIPPRRLNLHGAVVSVDRERDGFTKVAVTMGHCTEPQNVARHGLGCMVNHACESCPFFLVDPLEREAVDAKRHFLRVQLERARAVNAQQHLLDHYAGRIADCTTMIEGIDAYIDRLPEHERQSVRQAIASMSEVRRLACAPRAIDLRSLFLPEGEST